MSSSKPSSVDKKLAKMRINYHLSRSLQPDLQHSNSTTTAFRTIEQYYKRRLWQPDYHLAFGHHSIPPLDAGSSLHQLQWHTDHQPNPILVHIHTVPDPSPSVTTCHICPPRSSHQMCTFPKDYPGLIYLPSYLCEHQQAELVTDCLKLGLRKPNVTNLDAHWQAPFEGGIYELYESWLESSEFNQDGQHNPNSRFILQPQPSADRHHGETAGCAENSASTSHTQRRQRVDFEPITAENFLVARNEQPKEDPVGPPSSSKNSKPLHVRDAWMGGKIRWCTIGWQYHWPTKTYHFEREPTSISELVKSTCTKLINRLIPWSVVEDEVKSKGQERSENDGWKTDYKPEAGVINFYQYRDSLTAHIDHSEISTDSPLVSLSIGQACVFLISPSRDQIPMAIRLESGDALVMARESRRYFHGVPRIIEDSLPAWMMSKQSDDDQVRRLPWLDWFRSGGRINLNVRQVF